MDEQRIDRRGPPPGPRAGTQFEGMRGNLPHVATDENRVKVERMAGLQISQAEIAMVMGVSTDTIQRHYAPEFERGRALQGVKLREHAYTIAYGRLKNVDQPGEGYAAPPDGKMTMFLLERQFGMVAQSRTEHVGDPEAPVEIRHIRRVIVDPKDATNG